MVPTTIIRDMYYKQRVETTLLTLLMLTANQAYFAQENS